MKRSMLVVLREEHIDKKLPERMGCSVVATLWLPFIDLRDREANHAKGYQPRKSI